MRQSVITNTPPQFMRDVEVARYLGLSVGTIRRRRLEGVNSPPYRKFSGSIRYSKAEVDEWVKCQPGGGHLSDAVRQPAGSELAGAVA